MRFAFPGGARALFTSRADGNLSTECGAASGRGRVERERLCEALGLRWLCASRQVHGASVHRIATVDGGGGEPLALDVDGHATALRGVGAMVLVADCLPVVVLGDGAVAALHAGWRGLAAGVLEEGVEAVRRLGGRGQLTAIVGPGARGCCYEVGEDVHAAFAGEYGRAEHRRGRAPDSGRALDSAAFAGESARGESRGGRNLDLAALAVGRLRAAGVARVEDVEVCTICDPRFFSHRRESLDAGRQAGIAWLQS